MYRKPVETRSCPDRASLTLLLVCSVACKLWSCGILDAWSISFVLCDVCTRKKFLSRAIDRQHQTRVTIFRVYNGVSSPLEICAVGGRGGVIILGLLRAAAALMSFWNWGPYLRATCKYTSGTKKMDIWRLVLRFFIYNYVLFVLKITLFTQWIIGLKPDCS
jgi:hypothetical protein